MADLIEKCDLDEISGLASCLESGLCDEETGWDVIFPVHSC